MRTGLICILFAAAGAVTAQTVPDLEGVWLSNSATPLERPKVLEGRTVLTDEEVAELQKRSDKLVSDPSNDFQVGDAAFLSALNNVQHYESTTATDRTWEMIPRVFENRTSLITDPPDGRIPPLTPEAQKRRGGGAGRRAPRGPEDLNNIERCLTYGLPRLGGNLGAGPYSYYQIFQSPGYVVFFMEAIHEARIIPIDDPVHKRSHSSTGIRSWLGDSVGHYEGGTLVVDTVDLPERNAFMGSGPKLHLIERFTRVSATRLNYEVTIDDPDTWTKPWTVMVPLSATEEKIFEFACHEGNALVMKGMLEGGQ